MMGPKKLSTIRQELRQAILNTGNNPIEWLDERIRALEQAGKPADSAEVLQSLRRLLAPQKKPRRRARKPSVKK